MTKTNKKSPDMDLYIRLMTPNGDEYIIDANEDVFGPSWIIKQRIKYHIENGWIKYRGPGSGYLFGFIAREFENKKWIKLIDYKMVTDEEEEMFLSGHQPIY